jgi:hypothetical protein
VGRAVDLLWQTPMRIGAIYGLHDAGTALAAKAERAARSSLIRRRQDDPLRG